MSFFDKIKDATHINGPKHFWHRGSNEIFVASIVKIGTLNKDVLSILLTSISFHLFSLGP